MPLLLYWCCMGRPAAAAAAPLPLNTTAIPVVLPLSYCSLLPPPPLPPAMVLHPLTCTRYLGLWPSSRSSLSAYALNTCAGVGCEGVRDGAWGQ